MSNASSSCFRLTLIVVLLGFSVATAQAAIVPELTGSFTGTALGSIQLCVPFVDRGSVSIVGADGFFGNPASEWRVSSSLTSSTILSVSERTCRVQYLGTTDGPITVTFDGLTFKGTVTGGTFRGESTVLVSGRGGEGGCGALYRILE